MINSVSFLGKVFLMEEYFRMNDGYFDEIYNVEFHAMR